MVVGTLLAALAWGSGPRTAAVVARGLGGDPTAAPAAPVAPDALSDEIVAWARGVVPAQGTDEARLDALLRALSDRSDFGSAPVGTSTAREVFATGRANCLSLALLLVPLARELGIPAHYVRIRDLRTPVDLGGTVVVAGHVAAAVGSPGHVRVVDPVPTTDEEQRAAERISDAEVVALFHVNRGAEATLRGDGEAALAWFDLADAIAPGLPESRVDRGVALARSGRTEEAKAAWLDALRLDPWHGPAWRNLAGQLAADGDPEAARRTLDALSGEVARDPFTRLALGDAWARVGDLPRAAAAYRGAALTGGPAAGVRAARGELALDRDRPRSAARWLRRAERLDPAHPRVERLRRRLSSRPVGG